MPRVTRKARVLPCEWAEMLAHDLAEDALEIADAPVPLVEGRMDLGAVQAKCLQVELCKWLASQLLPEVYRDR
jgi:hypothetical protein